MAGSFSMDVYSTFVEYTFGYLFALTTVCQALGQLNGVWRSAIGSLCVGV